jgi:hypothetical protein
VLYFFDTVYCGANGSIPPQRNLYPLKHCPLLFK